MLYLYIFSVYCYSFLYQLCLFRVLYLIIIFHFIVILSLINLPLNENMLLFQKSHNLPLASWVNNTVYDKLLFLNGFQWTYIFKTKQMQRLKGGIDTKTKSNNTYKTHPYNIVPKRCYRCSLLLLSLSAFWENLKTKYVVTYARVLCSIDKLIRSVPIPRNQEIYLSVIPRRCICFSCLWLFNSLFLALLSLIYCVNAKANSRMKKRKQVI